MRLGSVVSRRVMRSLQISLVLVGLAPALMGSSSSVSVALPAEDSPAGCYSNADHAHASHTEDGFIGYGVTTKCEFVVKEIRIEMWGERSSWSGWRQHTEEHAHGTRRSVKKFRLRSHAKGLKGIYDYRSRGQAWSVEASGTYHTRQLTGKSVRKECPNPRINYPCSEV